MPVRTVQPEVSTVTVACGQRVFTSTLNSSTHFNPQDIYLKRYGAPGHDIEFVRKCLLTRDSPTNDPSFQPISLWIGKSWNKVRQSLFFVVMLDPEPLSAALGLPNRRAFLLNFVLR